jgi:hypothetical protein
MQAESTPISASRARVIRALNPASIRMPVFPAPTKVQLPELLLPNTHRRIDMPALYPRKAVSPNSNPEF